MNCISLVEQNIDRMTDKLFGDKDPNLKLITKMNLMYDGTEETKEEIEQTISKIKRNNQFEIECLLQEMTMTLDKDGNIVPTDDSYEKTKSNE